MYWDKEVKLENFQNMITVYEKHIEELEQENRSLKMQVDFLKEQLAYKTFGKPNNEEKV
jgi:cell division septum initiation protein DivIVA